jgi:hypothetical protein
MLTVLANPEIHLELATTFALMGSQVRLLQTVNMLDLGKVHIHEKVVRSFQLANLGCIPVEFDWEIEGEEAFTVKPSSGQVSVGDRHTIELCYQPTSAQTLNDFTVHCKICSGKTYTFKISATSRRPSINLGWTSHDFGRLYVRPEGAEPHRKPLILRNDDTKVCCPLEPDRHFQVAKTAAVMSVTSHVMFVESCADPQCEHLNSSAGSASRQ